MFDALLTFVADAFVWLVMGGVALRIVLNGLGSVMGGPRNPDYGMRETNTNYQPHSGDPSYGGVSSIGVRGVPPNVQEMVVPGYAYAPYAPYAPNAPYAPYDSYDGYSTSGSVFDHDF